MRVGETVSAGLDDMQARFWATAEPGGHLKYQVIAHLGKGNYGTVVSARKRRAGRRPAACAIKRIHNVFSLKEDAIKTLRELHFLRVFRHPNVVGLLDVLVPENEEAFNDVFLVTELMETDLDRLIKSKTVLDDCHIRWVMYQLLRALAYVHGARVSRRDVKPANILVDRHCNVKLCDFGLAKIDFPREVGVPVFWTDYVATRWYRSPELLCSRYSCEYTTQVDMWAAGCIMGELVNRCPMFPGRGVYHQLDLIILFCGTPSRRTLEKICSPKAREYLIGLLPQAPAAASSKKFASFSDEYMSLMRGLLTFDPNDRPDAETCCRHSLFEELRLSIDEACIQPPPQMTEESLPWEVADPATIADLRRMLYGEISAFSFEMAADSIATSTANAAEASAERTGNDTKDSSIERRCDRLPSLSTPDTSQAACRLTSTEGCSQGSRLVSLLPSGSYDEQWDSLCSDKGHATAATTGEQHSKSDKLDSVTTDRNFPTVSETRQRGPSTRQCPAGVGLHVNLEKRDSSQTKQPSNAAGVGNNARGAFGSCCGSKPNKPLARRSMSAVVIRQH